MDRLSAEASYISIDVAYRFYFILIRLCKFDPYQDIVVILSLSGRPNLNCLVLTTQKNLTL